MYKYHDDEYEENIEELKSDIHFNKCLITDLRERIDRLIRKKKIHDELD